MMKHSTLLLALLSGCAISVLAGAASADPPGRVGRISAVEGQVSFLPPGDDDWADATRNFPVTEGESFWTGEAGRAELQIGVMELSLDSETELDILALNYGETRLSLPQGSLDLRLWRVPRGGVSIATPAGEIRIDRPGVYRVDVGAGQDDGGYPPVEVTVFEGEAGAPGPAGFAGVSAGSAAVIYAGYDPDFEDAQDAAIDDWARGREAREHWDSQQAFSPSLTGYEDLEGYGEFVSNPDYGTVWYPQNVPTDWAPYRYGHWASVEPWGWTWIDDQSWGFAPFHYGRWVQIDQRWAWVPGQPDAEPVYAPALVAFVGGGGFDVGISVGAVGWIPLGPDEVYRPPYQVSEGYFRQLNVSNVRQTTIENITVNTVVNINQYRNAPAATVVRSDAFARGASVQQALAPVSRATLMQARPVAAAALPAPTPQAKTGRVFQQGPGASSLARATPAAAPPARLQSIRAAVAAQPAGSSRPPVIAGARITAPPPKPAAGAPSFVAPAQVKNPGAQARQPIASQPRAPYVPSAPSAPARGATPGVAREPAPPPPSSTRGSIPPLSPGAPRPVPPSPGLEEGRAIRPTSQPPSPAESIGERTMTPSTPKSPRPPAPAAMDTPAFHSSPPAARPVQPPAVAHPAPPPPVRPAKPPEDKPKPHDRDNPDQRPPQ